MYLMTHIVFALDYDSATMVDRTVVFFLYFLYRSFTTRRDYDYVDGTVCYCSLTDLRTIVWHGSVRRSKENTRQLPAQKFPMTAVIVSFMFGTFTAVRNNIHARLKQYVFRMHYFMHDSLTLAFTLLCALCDIAVLEKLSDGRGDGTYLNTRFVFSRISGKNIN
jgi:hypothetical protein